MPVAAQDQIEPSWQRPPDGFVRAPPHHDGVAEGDGAAITDSEPLSAYDRAVITGGIEE